MDLILVTYEKDNHVEAILACILPNKLLLESLVIVAPLPTTCTYEVTRYSYQRFILLQNRANNCVYSS